MRSAIVLLLVGLLAAAAGADPIRYEEIPADVVSYITVDVSRLLSLRVAQMPDGSSSFRQNREPVDSKHYHNVDIDWMTYVTMYATGKDGQPAVLVHGSTEKFRQDVEIPNSKDTTVFQYDHQDVHYSSACLLPGIFGSGKSAGESGHVNRPSINIGLGGAAAAFHGSFYTAYVGPDLVVMALDLPTMAEALDVLKGKRPSLAKEDPNGLKGPLPKGVVAVGAGLSASWMGGNLGTGDKAPNDKTAASTRPATISDPGASGLGMDLFGSFKGKARIARFDCGENEQNDYVDATFTMINPDSALQLKNLLLGVKALLSLTQAQQRPFIDPLEVDTAANDVVLHWAMPVEKLGELLRKAGEGPTHENADSTPATEPSH